MTWVKTAPRVKQWEGPAPTPRATVTVPTAPARPIISLPKPIVRRNREYLRWVAGLRCAHCGKAGPSQAAHADEGKGMATKAGDDTVFPLCADTPGRPGCHSFIGYQGLFTRKQRRALEKNYGENTRKQAIASGAYPEDWL